MPGQSDGLVRPFSGLGLVARWRAWPGSGVRHRLLSGNSTGVGWLAHRVLAVAVRRRKISLENLMQRTNVINKSQCPCHGDPIQPPTIETSFDS